MIATLVHDVEKQGAEAPWRLRYFVRAVARFFANLDPVYPTTVTDFFESRVFKGATTLWAYLMTLF